MFNLILYYSQQTVKTQCEQTIPSFSYDTFVNHVLEAPTPLPSPYGNQILFNQIEKYNYRVNAKAVASNTHQWLVNSDNFSNISLTCRAEICRLVQKFPGHAMVPIQMKADNG